jgi:hypothetical protein
VGSAGEGRVRHPLRLLSKPSRVARYLALLLTGISARRENVSSMPYARPNLRFYGLDSACQACRLRLRCQSTYMLNF